MENITSAEELKNAIQILSVEQTIKEKQLKEQFHVVFEGLKPSNLIKSTLKDVLFSPGLAQNIAGTAIGLTTGYLSKRIVTGASVNIIRKLLGSALQIGVSNLVAKNSAGLLTIGGNIFRKIFQKKKKNSEIQ